MYNGGLLQESTAQNTSTKIYSSIAGRGPVESLTEGLINPEYAKLLTEPVSFIILFQFLFIYLVYY